MHAATAAKAFHRARVRDPLLVVGCGFAKLDMFEREREHCGGCLVAGPAYRLDPIGQP